MEKFKKYLLYVILSIALFVEVVSITSINSEAGTTAVFGSATATTSGGETVNGNYEQKWTVSTTVCGIPFKVAFNRRSGQSWSSFINNQVISHTVSTNRTAVTKFDKSGSWVAGYDREVQTWYDCNVMDSIRWVASTAYNNLNYNYEELGLNESCVDGMSQHAFQQMFYDLTEAAFEAKRKEINENNKATAEGEIFYAEVDITAAEWEACGKGSKIPQLQKLVVEKLRNCSNIASKGTVEENTQAGSVIDSATTGSDTSSVKTLAGLLNGNYAVYDKNKDGKTFTVPVYIKTPCWPKKGDGVIKYSEFINQSQFAGGWPVVGNTSEGQALVSNFLAGQNVVGNNTDASSTFTTQIDNYFITGKYVIAWEPESANGNGGFYAVGSPKNKNVVGPWNTEEVSEYKLYLNPEQSMLDAEKGNYTFTITITDNGGIPGNLLSTECISSVAIKSFTVNNNVATLVVDRAGLAAFIGQGTGTNGKAYIHYKFKVPGNGKEDKQTYPHKVKFTVTSTSQLLGLKTWAPGTTNEDPDFSNGATLTSYVPSGDPIPGMATPNFVHFDWELHTVPTPTVAGRLVANKYGEETFEATTAIPNTENVSALLGAETSMIDLSGYLTATENGVAGAFGGPENNKWTAAPNAAVNRTVKISAVCSNVWGCFNSLCRLSPTSQGVSGGKAWSCNASSASASGDASTTHSGNHGQWTCEYHNWTRPSHQWGCTVQGGGFSDILDGQGNKIGESPITNTCGCGASCGSHNCTWGLTINNGTSSINANGVRAENKSILTPFTIAWSGGNLGSRYLSSGNTNPVTGGGGNLSWGSFVSSWESGDTTNSVSGSLTWTPINNQYYKVTGTVTIKNQNETKTLTGSLGSSGQLLCEGYTFGIGDSVSHKENCVHPAERVYTLKYVESVDNYVYRRITNAVVYSLLGSELANVNQVSFSGGPANGTSGAPLTDDADGQAVTAPNLFGALWRGLEGEYGEYKDMSGRIIFEAFKDMKMYDNVLQDSNPNYPYGDCQVTLNIISDHEYFGQVFANYGGNYMHNNMQVGVNNEYYRGSDEGRYMSNFVTSDSTKYQTRRLGDAVYANWGEIKDNHNAAYDGNSGIDEFNNYGKLIRTSQWVTGNAWQNRNKDDNYHANIVSDTFAYGNTQYTTVVRGDIYSVDEGIPLFNYAFGANTSGYDVDGGVPNGREITIYRNHNSRLGKGKTLLQLMMGDKMSVAHMTSNQPMPHVGYSDHGMNPTDGGHEALSTTITGALYTGQLSGYVDNRADDVKAYLTKGDNVNTSTIYSNKVPAIANSGSKGGCTTIEGTVSGCGSSTRQFAGYWKDFTFNSKHSNTLTTRVNGSTPIAEGTFSGCDCGTHNLSEYGTSMVIADLALNPNTPNGQWNTCDALFTYKKTLIAETPDAKAASYVRTQEDLTFITQNNTAHENVVNDKVRTDLTDIYIYNPISVEFSQAIGNEYGNWSGDASKTPDETQYDQRVETYDTPLNQKDAYTTNTRRSQIWITPLGDMNKVSGTGMSSSSKGSNYNTGQVYRNQGLQGYVADMNTEKWIADWYIQYPYMVKYESETALDTNKQYNIEIMDRVYGSFKAAPDKLQNYKDDSRDMQFKYGDCFQGKTTLATEELNPATVKVYAEAKTAYVQTGGNSARSGFTDASIDRNTRTTNRAVKEIPIEVVGQIGNLAIHDTTDFRFSNFFKKPLDEWLVDGVVKKVDETEPVRIVAGPYDILSRPIERDAKITEGKPTHATLQITEYGSGQGLGGPYQMLPLVPAYNSIKELKSEALRIGYKTLASIETIGSYQSLIEEGIKYPVTTAQEKTGVDNRKEYLEIISHYYLYDFDDGKYYAIDLWSGSTGAKTRVYNGLTDKAELSENSEALYVNYDNEGDRRNVSDMEIILSNSQSQPVIGPTFLESGEEYIGYTGYLKLDNRDLTYIGSDYTEQDGYGAYRDSISDTGTFSQRWHFTQGLTSTTIPTYHIDSYDQAVIEASAKKLKAEHPHAVIVEFNDFIAHGKVWNLRYEGSYYNNPTIKFYSDVAGERPEWITGSSKTVSTYQGAKVYDRTGTSALYTIDKELTPLVVYEAYKTAADDRTVSGTH